MEDWLKCQISPLVKCRQNQIVTLLILVLYSSILFQYGDHLQPAIGETKKSVIVPCDCAVAFMFMLRHMVILKDIW